MGKREKLSVPAKKNNSPAYLHLLDFCIPEYVSVVCDSQVLFHMTTDLHKHLPKPRFSIRDADEVFTLLTQLCSMPITASSFTVRVLKLFYSLFGTFLITKRPILWVLRRQKGRREAGNCLSVP